MEPGQRNQDHDSGKRSKPTVFERWMLASSTGVALAVGLAAVLAHGLKHGLATGIGLGIFCFCFCALSWGPARGAARATLCGFLLLGLGVGVWTMLPARSTGANDGPSKPRPPVATETVGRPIVLGIHPRDLVRGAGGLLAVTDSGIVAFAPTSSVEQPRAQPVARDRAVAAVAADGSRLVVLGAGFASVYDTRTYRRVLPTLHYSESSGPVAVGDGAAWLCNVTHSKLDRLDLHTGALTEFDVPGVPNDVLLANGAVWVTVASGWLERIDLHTWQVAVYPTEDDPETLLFANGTIWISHPENRFVTRLRPDGGARVGQPVRVRADARAMVAFAGSVFVVSGATDALQRIDPKAQRVVSTIALPLEPSGVVAFGGRLFITSAGRGTAVPVTIRPLPRRAP
jgi:hypothetical protein